MQDAESEETLYNAVYNDDSIQLLLMKAGFTNELVKLNNKYRACQAIILHLVFKTRKEELNITKRSKMKNASFKDREIAIIATMLECNGSIKGFPEFVIAAVDIG